MWRQSHCREWSQTWLWHRYTNVLWCDTSGGIYSRVHPVHPSSPAHIVRYLFWSIYGWLLISTSSHLLMSNNSASSQIMPFDVAVAQVLLDENIWVLPCQLLCCSVLQGLLDRSVILMWRPSRDLHSYTTNRHYLEHRHQRLELHRIKSTKWTTSSLMYSWR